MGAAVVPGQSGTVTERELLLRCRGALAPHEVPQRLVVVPSLPHTAKGAVDRGTVAELYGH
ncbi:AMP-binding enzyme [Streptomyces mexicanus]|uniref:AMP-binding enzyme n=1 Tax=Streptomyces mexicanus TaxID=178566 RepID=UPI0036CA3AB0